MIKKFNEYIIENINFPTTEREIDHLCNKYQIENFTINSDMSIDVNGDVGFYGEKLEFLPLKFNRITNGSFGCNNNKLISLEGCPKYVDRGFNCSFNKLKTLKGSPEYVGISVDISDNPKLYSLDGCTKEIGEKYFSYHDTPIEEILGFFANHLLAEQMEKILEAWDLYSPVYEKNGKWYVWDFRLRQLYLDICEKEYRPQFHFKNYIVDKT